MLATALAMAPAGCIPDRDPNRTIPTIPIPPPMVFDIDETAMTATLSFDLSVDFAGTYVYILNLTQSDVVTYNGRCDVNGDFTSLPFGAVLDDQIDITWRKIYADGDEFVSTCVLLRPPPLTIDDLCP